MNSAEEIAALKKKLALAESAMEEFAYSVSHDLREPVRMVKSFMDLLVKRYGEGLDPKALTYINYAADGAGRLDVMIQDLLLYYRAVKGLHNQPVHLQPVAEKAAAALKAKYTHRHPDIQIGQLPVVEADAEAVQRLIEYTAIHLFDYQAADNHTTPSVELFSAAPGELVVAAAGPPLPEGYLRDLFGLFHKRAQQQQPGSSLNYLAVARRITEHSGGSLTATTTPDGGLQFRFNFRTGSTEEHA